MLEAAVVTGPAAHLPTAGSEVFGMGGGTEFT